MKWFLVIVLIITFSKLEGQANCYGICDTGQQTPCYNITLPVPDASVTFTMSGLNACCMAIPSNYDCAQLTISYPPLTAGFIFEFLNTPCSFDFYDASSGCNEDSFPACDAYCTNLDPGGGSIVILLCKQGGFVDVDVFLMGIAKPVLTVKNIIEGCQANFEVVGEEDGTVTWSSSEDPTLQYISCADMTMPPTCLNPVFNYTGSSITDCDGIMYSYTVEISANSCGPVVLTETALVYPKIQGSVNVQCSPSEAILTFVPVIDCPSLTYLWFESGNPLMDETNASLIIDPAYAKQYCVDVSRAEITDECTAFQVCTIPDCCVDTLWINEVPIPPSTYRASQVIYAGGELFNTPFETIFKVGQSIRIDSSLIIHEGAILKLIIDQCISEN